MKITREIKQWVLSAAGFHNTHMHGGFVEQVLSGARRAYPGAEILVSFTPLGHNDRGPGKPWEIEGETPGDATSREIRKNLERMEHSLLEHTVRTRFSPHNPHPEDREARICRRCGQGIAVDHRMPGSKAIHKIATNPNLYVKAMTGQINPNNMRETVCSRCRTPML